jgi:hypothetical protein
VAVNTEKAIGALELLTFVGVIVGEVKDHGGMPRPVRLGAVFLFYGLLGVVASTGREAGRIAYSIGVVVTLGALVTGTAGKNLVGLLNAFSRAIGPSTQTQATPPAPGGHTTA